MKIALFGDKNYANRDDSTKIGLSWVNYLENNFNYTITSYTDTLNLWNTYEKFLINYRLYDVIIFVVTSCGKLSSDKISIQDKNHATVLVKKMEMQNENDQIKKDILNASMLYFEYFQNEEQELFLHGKIIESIIDKCEKYKKKLILLPVYEDSISYQNIFDISLVSVYDHQRLKNNVENMDFNTFINRLSPRNNEILAEKIDGIIRETCDKVILDDFEFEQFEDPSIYWPLLKKGT